MSAPVKHLVVRLDGEPVRISFTNNPAASRVIHWVQLETAESHRWEQADCTNLNCPLCLAGDRVAQRFTVEVVFNAEVHVLTLPLNAWKVVLDERRRLGDQFAQQQYLIGLAHDVKGAAFPSYTLEAIQ